MKKSFQSIFVVVTAIALMGCASVTVSKREQCTGGGAVAGAVVAGPIGAVVGAVAGNVACK